jgi:prevent-host-death family protein
MVADAVNIHEAKTNFSKLVSRVMAGEEIVIAKAGKPVARLVPERPSSTARRIPGIDKGKLRIADDFDTMSQQELDEWYGRDLRPR